MAWASLGGISALCWEAEGGTRREIEDTASILRPTREEADGLPCLGSSFSLSGCGDHPATRPAVSPFRGCGKQFT